MPPEQSLDRIERLLDEERDALRRLDGARVDALTDEKAALIHGLHGSLPGRADLAPRMRAVAAGLRRNAVLLAHARDCLRDVLAAVHEAPGPASVHLSLHG